MPADVFRFDRFSLDRADRRLLRDGKPVDLNARYFDALALLVSEAGKLVSKDRFLEEVWRGVPVTDEALTQCVKALRRALGDEASRPRFIETVPKHGYRFVATVDVVGDVAVASEPAETEPPTPNPAPVPVAPGSWRELLLVGAAGTIGAGVAGIIGGLFYGFVAASQPPGEGAGAVSVLLVLLWLTLAAALMGGAGVSFGIASGWRSGRPSLWSIAGGAAGGLVVGAVVKLLGLDAFNLLLGQSPTTMTGGPEGALLGAGVGLGAWLAARPSFSLRRGVALAALAGAGSGALIALLGGSLMGGSLSSLAIAFPASRLRLDSLGALSGEADFGPVAQAVTGILEAMLFAGCVTAGIILGRRRLERKYGAQRD